MGGGEAPSPGAPCVSSEALPTPLARLRNETHLISPVAHTLWSFLNKFTLYFGGYKIDTVKYLGIDHIKCDNES